MVQHGLIHTIPYYTIPYDKDTASEMVKGRLVPPVGSQGAGALEVTGCGRDTWGERTWRGEAYGETGSSEETEKARGIHRSVLTANLFE